MKRIYIILFVAALDGGMSSVYCKEIINAEQQIHVSKTTINDSSFVISSHVSEAIKKLPAEKSEKLGKLIYTGNAFLSKLLDYSIFEDDEKWAKNNASLLTVSAEEFFNWANQWGVGNQYWHVCKGALLSELVEISDGGASLTYQMRYIGKLTYSSEQSVHHHARFMREKAGDVWQISLQLNSDGKILGISPGDDVIPMFYKAGLLKLQAPRIRKHFYLDDTDDAVVARVNNYDQVIHEVNQAAADICESEFNTEEE